VTSFVVDALQDEGYQVDRATNGMEALARCVAAPPDAILLDLLLPAMDGWQFMDALREHMTMPPPVIVMTANRGAWDHATEAGAAAYLAKPFDIEDLLDSLDRVLSKHGTGEEEAAPVSTAIDPAAPSVGPV
jgi:DNA-binding response OmpR family regulator